MDRRDDLIFGSNWLDGMGNCRFSWESKLKLGSWQLCNRGCLVEYARRPWDNLCYRLRHVVYLFHSWAKISAILLPKLYLAQSDLLAQYIHCQLAFHHWWSHEWRQLVQPCVPNCLWLVYLLLVSNYLLHVLRRPRWVLQMGSTRLVEWWRWRTRHGRDYCKRFLICVKGFTGYNNEITYHLF